MMNLSPVAALAIALITGIISGFGIGGGTLLILALIWFFQVDQRIAQGVNLAYFIPTALGALFFHIRRGRVDWRAGIPAAIAGVTAAWATARLSAGLDVTVLRRLFGVLLLYVGVRELFTKKSGPSPASRAKSPDIPAE